jgi:hypothetical protein
VAEQHGVGDRPEERGTDQQAEHPRATATPTHHADVTMPTAPMTGAIRS